jgi:hypothetical protein
MKLALYRLVTLLEILETSAEAFWRLSSILGQLMVRLENNQIDHEIMHIAAGSLGELMREAERLNLRSAVQQLERIKEQLFGPKRGTIDSLRPMLMNLHLRILDTFEDRFFLIVPPELIDLYRQPKPAFGAEVEAKFPQMSEDISESGKCLALGRATAAVFHLMRVMEIGTQKLGDKLNVQLSSEKRWQNILDEVNKAIKALDHKAAETKAYAATAAHLYNVKLAWRNEVMHPKQTYTQEEAIKVHSAVDTFIRDLASIL